MRFCASWWPKFGFRVLFGCFGYKHMHWVGRIIGVGGQLASKGGGLVRCFERKKKSKQYFGFADKLRGRRDDLALAPEHGGIIRGGRRIVVLLSIGTLYIAQRWLESLIRWYVECGARGDGRLVLSSRLETEEDGSNFYRERSLTFFKSDYLT